MTTQDWWLEEKGREGRTGRGLTTHPDHDNTRLVAGGERKEGWEGLAGDSPHSRTMTTQDWWLEEKGREGRTGRGLTTQPDHDNTRLVAGGEREGGKDRQGTHHTVVP